MKGRGVRGGRLRKGSMDEQRRVGGGEWGWGRRMSESTPGAEEVDRAVDGRRKLAGVWESKRRRWHGSMFWVVIILNAMWLGKNMVMAEQRGVAMEEGREEWSLELQAGLGERRRHQGREEESGGLQGGGKR